jgi:hypothetical protein
MEAKRISSKKAFELLEQYNSAIEIYGSTTGKRVNLKACVGACIDDYRRYIIKREVEIVRKSQANCIKGFDKFLIR